MCGVSGLIDPTGTLSDPSGLIRGMTDTLSHRGPDDSGVWADPQGAVHLGHRRLSIIDLSDAGHQPMLSPSGRFVISYNGEIYNYLELRAELMRFGTPFQGSSDTEVMLNCIERWGLETALEKFVGMFAFALWDCAARTMILVRDRVGIKPLYYTCDGRVAGFASELTAIRRLKNNSLEIDRDALDEFLRYGHVPAPRTIYKNVRKVRPGTIVRLAVGPGNKIEEREACYWDPSEVVSRGVSGPRPVSQQEALEGLEQRLIESVRGRMIADVPVGAFLSGGIDSSTVVALMQGVSARAVRTFTIGFDVPGYNEAEHAAAVAKHLGTDHTELYLTPEAALDTIPLLPRLYDEPFADSSQIPTYLVSKLARETVKVSLSGDGGDELFGGYNRHVWGERVWAGIRILPLSLRHRLGRILRAQVPDRAGPLVATLMRTVAGLAHVAQPGEKLSKLGRILDVSNPSDLYERLISLWPADADVVRGVERTPPSVSADSSLSLTEYMMYRDLVGYLPDDILVKVDRASMAVGLEARVPLLDHRVIEYAWQLPLNLKVRKHGKHLLRKLLDKYVPRELAERPKSGFSVPLGSWLRGPLRDWAQDLLSPDSIESHGLMNPGPIVSKWEKHAAGREDWQHELWCVLMFQAWYREQASLPK
jgi:asparagine synthase (glutamine-hydrolysing)